MKKYRIAATGVSHWHSLFDAEYLPFVAKMPDMEIVGVEDPDPRIAAHRAEALGVPGFTDYREMIEKAKPDFVIALGRHIDMAATAHFLLDHDIPFLMEKPMGMNAGEVLSIADKADEKGAFVAVPLPHRHLPQAKISSEMISKGELGDLSHFYFRIIRPSSQRYVGWDSGWALDPKLSGGGCLRNLGSHGLDLFLHFTGGPAEVTGASVSNRGLGQDVEDFATVTVRSANGVIGTVEVGNVFPLDGTDAAFKLAGNRKYLIGDGKVLRVIDAGGEETVPNTTAESRSYLVIREALDDWIAGRPPTTSARDLHPVIKLIDDAYALAGAPSGSVA